MIVSVAWQLLHATQHQRVNAFLEEATQHTRDEGRADPSANSKMGSEKREPVLPWKAPSEEQILSFIICW